MDATTFRPGETQKIDFTDTAAAHGIAVADEPGRTYATFRVVSTVDAFVKIGAGAVATKTGPNPGFPIAAGLSEYLDVAEGERVSVIGASDAGSAYVTRVRKG